MQFIINKHSVKSFIVWGVWTILLIAGLSLTFGSYQEMEPMAGNIFAFISVTIFVLGVGLLLWRRHRHIN
jgi:hypothetical protein